MSKRVTISIVMNDDLIKMVDNYAKDHMRSRSMSMELLVKQQLQQELQQKEADDGICG